MKSPMRTPPDMASVGLMPDDMTSIIAMIPPPMLPPDVSESIIPLKIAVCMDTCA